MWELSYLPFWASYKCNHTRHTSLQLDIGLWASVSGVIHWSCKCTSVWDCLRFNYHHAYYFTTFNAKLTKFGFVINKFFYFLLVFNTSKVWNWHRVSGRSMIPQSSMLGDCTSSTWIGLLWAVHGKPMLQYRLISRGSFWQEPTLSNHSSHLQGDSETILWPIYTCWEFSVRFGELIVSTDAD